MNPLCFVCPHRDGLIDPKHECHITTLFRNFRRKLRKRNSLERYGLAIQEMFVNKYAEHTATLIANVFNDRKDYGKQVLQEAMKKLEKP